MVFVEVGVNLNIMKESNAPKSKKSQRTVLVVFLVLLAVLGIMATVTILVPLLRGDGLSRYSGAKGVVANEALNAERELLNGQAMKIVTQFHIDEVRPTTASEITTYCSTAPSMPSQDVNDPHHYTVVVSSQQLFSWNIKKTTYDGCYFLPQGDRPGGGR